MLYVFSILIICLFFFAMGWFLSKYRSDKKIEPIYARYANREKEFLKTIQSLQNERDALQIEMSSKSPLTEQDISNGGKFYVIKDMDERFVVRTHDNLFNIYSSNYLGNYCSIPEGFHKKHGKNGVTAKVLLEYMNSNGYRKNQ